MPWCSKLLSAIFKATETLGWHACDSVNQRPQHYEIACAPSGNLKVNMF